MDKNHLPGQAHAFHGDNGKSGEANVQLLSPRRGSTLDTTATAPHPDLLSFDSAVMGHAGR